MSDYLAVVHSQVNFNFFPRLVVHKFFDIQLNSLPQIFTTFPHNLSMERDRAPPSN